MRILEGEQSLNNLKERIKGDEVGRGHWGHRKKWVYMQGMQIGDSRTNHFH